MLLGVQFSRLVAVVFRVEVVGVRDVRVVRRLFVMTFLMRLRGFAMVFGGQFVVFRRLLMMLQFFFVGHDAMGD